MTDLPTTPEAPAEEADATAASRHPDDYMRPGMKAYTAEEFAYVEQQHEEANR